MKNKRPLEKITKRLLASGTLLFVLMCVHIPYAYFKHLSQSGNSAPASVNFLLAVLYIPAIAALFIVAYFYQKKHNNSTKK